MRSAQDAYSSSELAPLLEIAPRNVRERAKRESWRSRPRRGRGGGREWIVSSMPDATRLALAGTETSASAEAAALKLREELAAQAAETGRQSALSAFAALPEARKSRAEARALTVRLCEDYLAASGLPRRRGTELFCARVRSGQAALPDWAREALPAKLSAGSLRNWRKALDREGLDRLAGRQGLHRKGSGKIDSTPAMAEFCLAMLKEYPHATAHALLKGLLARFGEGAVPTLRAVQRWHAGWIARNAQLFLAVKNPDAWRNRYMAAGGDAANVTRLNERWEMDSTPGDLLLSDGGRHTVVGCIDVFTRRLTLRVSRSSSSAAVAATLRQALMAWGVPEEVKTDNGSDYVSRHMTQLFLGLDIRHTLCAPFSPQQKPFIERALGTFSHDLLELLPGFVGHNVAERKDIEARRSFAQRIMRQGGEPLELRMSPEDLQTYCDRWTEDVYGRRPHPGLDGKSPWQVAVEWPHTLRRITDERALDVLLLPAPGGEGTRRVTKKGIRLDGALYDHAVLGGLEGRDVLVKLDEADVGAVYVFSLDGPFICRALCPEIAGVSRRDVALARKRRQQAVMAEGKAMLREAAKNANVKNIAQEILAGARVEAAKVQALPKPADAWETPALAEAGIAARATNAPAGLTPAQEAELAAAAETMPLLDRAAPAPEMPEIRFGRAMHFLELLQKGGRLDAQKTAWLNSYVTTPEFKGFKRLYDDFGGDWMPFYSEAASAGG